MDDILRFYKETHAIKKHKIEEDEIGNVELIEEEPKEKQKPKKSQKQIFYTKKD